MSFHKIKIIPMYSSLNILFINNIFSNNEKESENEYEHENNTESESTKSKSLNDSKSIFSSSDDDKSDNIYHIQNILSSKKHINYDVDLGSINDLYEFSDIYLNQPNHKHI